LYPDFGLRFAGGFVVWVSLIISLRRAELAGHPGAPMTNKSAGQRAYKPGIAMT
jgi:hypothetical protein